MQTLRIIRSGWSCYDEAITGGIHYKQQKSAGRPGPGKKDDIPRIDITEMPFAKRYPLLVNKAGKKGLAREEVDQVTAWFTGYNLGE